jgi:septal ring factor EnvC (AmiA/AmiB activator)
MSYDTKQPTKADLQDIVHKLEHENKELHGQIYAMSNTLEALKARLIDKEFQLVDFMSMNIASKRQRVPNTVEELTDDGANPQ